MRIKRLPVSDWRLLFLSFAFALGLPGSGFAQDGYNNPTQVNTRIEQIRQKSGGLVSITRLAASPGGTGVLLMTIGQRTDNPKPAILVVGNLSGINA